MSEQTKWDAECGLGPQKGYYSLLWVKT